jgi:hypothetical protein
MTFEEMAVSHSLTAKAENLEEPEDEFVPPEPHRRMPLLTQLLATAIAIVVAFTVGVLVQKQHDAGLTASTSFNPASLSGLAGLPGGSGSATGSSSTSSGPVLIGTVVAVSGSDVTVKDLGGTTHVVHTSSSTTVTISQQSSVGALPVGSTVSIDGTKAADGSVTASSVTSR